MKNVLLLAIVLICSWGGVYAQGTITKTINHSRHSGENEVTDVTTADIIKLTVGTDKYWYKDYWGTYNGTYYTSLFFRGNESGKNDPLMIYDNYKYKRYINIQETRESMLVQTFNAAAEKYVIVKFPERLPNSKYDFILNLRFYKNIINLPKSEDGRFWYYYSFGKWEDSYSLYDGYVTADEVIGYDGLGNYTFKLHVHDIVEISTIPAVYNEYSNTYNITVNLSKQGSGNLTYSIDGGGRQSGNSFSGITAGRHTVKVEDNRTGYSTERIVMLRDMTVNPTIRVNKITNTDCSGKTGGIDISVEGIPGYLEFDGNSKIEFKNQLFTGKSNFTLEGWFKLSSQDYYQMIRKSRVGLFGQNNCVEVGLKDGKPSFYTCTDQGQKEVTSNIVVPNDEQWHHIALRGDATNDIVELLFDGMLVAELDDDFSKLRSDDQTGGQPISIGGSVWGNDRNDCFKGSITNVNMWGRDLTDGELARTTKGDENGLLANYSMNTRNGNILQSGIGEEGTIQQGVKWNGTINYQWYLINKDNESITLSEQTGEDLINAEDGNYRVEVNYVGDVTRGFGAGPYTVNLDNNLKMQFTVSHTDGKMCEGEELSINASVTGGTGNYKYIWWKWDNISGKTNTNVTAAEYKEHPPLGSHTYVLHLVSGKCHKDEEVSPKYFNIHKKISTGRIRRRR